jgi:hypothetical protein
MRAAVIDLGRQFTVERRRSARWSRLLGGRPRLARDFRIPASYSEDGRDGCAILARESET